MALLLGAGRKASLFSVSYTHLDVYKRQERLCPDAFLINFTNPSGIITEALQQQSAVKCAGLCNIPLTIQKTIAAFLDVDVYKRQVHGVTYPCVLTKDLCSLHLRD